MLDCGQKIVVLEYISSRNELHTLSISDVSKLNTPDIMGISNSISLACSGSQMLGDNGCVAVYAEQSLIHSSIQPLAFACTIIYDQCLLFTLLPVANCNSDGIGKRTIFDILSRV